MTKQNEAQRCEALGLMRPVTPSGRAYSKHTVQKETSMNVEIITPGADLKVGKRKIDARRGALDGSVSSQWYSRPDDQRFLDLESLFAATAGRRDMAKVGTVETRHIRVKRTVNDPRAMTLVLPEGEVEVHPNHWTFSQLCQRIKAPAGFIRDRLVHTAGIVVQECLNNGAAELVKVMHDSDGYAELRAITGPDYGRVWDAEVVQLAQQIASDGTWKVPGTIDWGRGEYDPNTPVTKTTTTLYASDRDVFIFLCRDQYPIEIGKLPNGDPDYLFPGFIISNSEVGSRSLSIQTMWLRGACENRNLWGVEDKKMLRMRHSKGLPQRFADEALPKLQDFSKASANAVARKVAAAKRAIVGKNDEEVEEFILKEGFTKTEAKNVFDQVYGEGAVRSIWDVVQGLTEQAREIPFQDQRVEFEQRAGALMNRVTV